MVSQYALTVTANTGRILGGYAGFEAFGALNLTNTSVIGSGTVVRTGNNISYTPGGRDGVRALDGGTIHNNGVIHGDAGAGIYVAGATLTLDNLYEVTGDSGVYTYGNSKESLIVTNEIGGDIESTTGEAVHSRGSGAVTVSNSSVISAFYSGVYSAGVLKLSNDNQITSSHGDGVLYEGSSAVILNTNTISATNTAGAVITNAGGASFTGGSNNVDGYAVHFASDGGTFNNYGLVTGGLGGVWPRFSGVA